METKPRFIVSKLSDAAFLTGVKHIRCIDLTFDKDNSARVLFVFDIDPEEGQRLILEFGSSQAFSFDSAVKDLKGRLFNKIRSGGNRDHKAVQS